MNLLDSNIQQRMDHQVQLILQYNIIPLYKEDSLSFIDCPWSHCKFQEGKAI